MVALGLVGALACAAPEPPRRNVILLGLDTLRADLLVTWGGEPGLTPRLDRLADEGIAFLDLTAPSPWTLPSFATLMTGLPPQTHGAGYRQGESDRLRDVTFTPLGAASPTLAERFAAAGYRTAGFYNNPFLGPSFGLDRGFESYERLAPPHRAGVVVDRALGWLEGGSNDAPFFLFLHFFDPHTPYEPPAEPCRAEVERAGLDPSGPCSLARSSRRETPAPQRPRAAALYRAEVAYLDAEIGRLLDALEARGLTRDLVLLAASDHGESFWERETLERERGYTAGADHGKTHFQELVQVPAILWGSHLTARRIARPAELADLYPTLLAAAGLEPTAGTGSDLLAPGPPPVEPARVSDFLLYGPQRAALQRGGWKLVLPLDGSRPVELYHLESDPGERRDVAAERPEIASSMRRRLEAELERRREAGRRLAAPTAGVAIDDELRRELEALGYLN